jgi:hypothetical protein
MFIRKVTKKNKNSDKTYTYYRLTRSYRVGNKTRQQVILNLGGLENFAKEKHKSLADRIEELLTGTQSAFPTEDAQIENLAQKYYKELVQKGLFSEKPNNQTGSSGATYTEVDLSSAEELESKSLGGEWVAKQAFERLSISAILGSIGMQENDILISKALLTAKMIHPSSELEAERWLKENSSTMELYQAPNIKATRYQLYKVAELLYTHKDHIEQQLYQVSKNLFSQKSKVVIFDLTNMHFEGMMQSSDRAKFGRPKQKRTDCRLVSLALTIDSLGFIRGSQFWDGNVSEPGTLQNMLDYIDQQFEKEVEKPLLVFDAGISTEENLAKVRDKYDYVCVSRSIPKEFTRLSKEATQLTDNRGNSIAVTKVETSTKETMLLVVSQQKKKKEDAMDAKKTQQFEERLNYLKEGLNMPRRIKTIKAVHEHVGRLKTQFSKVAKYYVITYTEDEKRVNIKDVHWTIKTGKAKPKGQYFLRYSKKDLTDEQIWDAYNLTREVEASFRCLKSDLNVRPIFHQKDSYIEIHIWLSILAYQVVNYITQVLKEKDITYSWKTIVEKLKAQNLTTTSINVKGNKKAYLKTCTRPNADIKEIYEALLFKERPFVRKTKVVTQ